ncbi:MAG: hypothetical protein WD077_13095 [Bacteroidia bacterium]
MKQQQNPSASYFKHTVYGLRYLFRLFGREDRAIHLPSMKEVKQLPVVSSKEECRRLFGTPRMFFGCIARKGWYVGLS